MVYREVEIDQAVYEYFERLAEERGRSVTEELKTFLFCLSKDPEYLDRLQEAARRRMEGEEWKDQSVDEED